MSLVSVMMTAYQAEGFIDEAIRSVLAQTYFDWELLIIDDGSTDQTLQIAQSVADPRIRVFSLPENRGITHARNRVLQEMKGEHLAILDSDDVADPLRFAKQRKWLDEHSEAVAVGSDVELIDESGRVLGLQSVPYLATKDLSFFLYFGAPLTNSSMMVRRSAVVDLCFDPRLPPSEDYDFWSRVSERGQIGVIREPLTRYRIHGKSASFVSGGAQKRNSKIVIEERLSRNFPELTQEERSLHAYLFQGSREEAILYFRGSNANQISKYLNRFLSLVMLREKTQESDALLIRRKILVDQLVRKAGFWRLGWGVWSLLHGANLKLSDLGSKNKQLQALWLIVRAEILRRFDPFGKFGST